MTFQSVQPPAASGHPEDIASLQAQPKPMLPPAHSGSQDRPGISTRLATGFLRALAQKLLMITQFETTWSEERGAEPQFYGVSLWSCECVVVLGEGAYPAAGFTPTEKKAKPLTARTRPFLSACSSGADPAQG